MDKMTIGGFIASLRKENGITQQEMADRLNISNKSVSRWECDKTTPDITLIPAIAEMFGVTADELLRGQRIGKATPTGERIPFRADAQIKQLINRSLSRFKVSAYVTTVIPFLGFINMFAFAAILHLEKIGFIGFMILTAIGMSLLFLMLNIGKTSVGNSGLIEPNGTEFSMYKQTLHLITQNILIFYTFLYVLAIPFFLGATRRGRGYFNFEDYLELFLYFTPVFLISAIIVKFATGSLWRCSYSNKFNDQPFIRRKLYLLNIIGFEVLVLSVAVTYWSVNNYINRIYYEVFIALPPGANYDFTIPVEAKLASLAPFLIVILYFIMFKVITIQKSK